MNNIAGMVTRIGIPSKYIDSYRKKVMAELDLAIKMKADEQKTDRLVQRKGDKLYDELGLSGKTLQEKMKVYDEELKKVDAMKSKRKSYTEEEIEEKEKVVRRLLSRINRTSELSPLDKELKKMSSNANKEEYLYAKYLKPNKSDENKAILQDLVEKGVISQDLQYKIKSQKRVDDKQYFQ
jgi:hypothetical protein